MAVLLKSLSVPVYTDNYLRIREQQSFFGFKKMKKRSFVEPTE